MKYIVQTMNTLTLDNMTDIEEETERTWLRSEKMGFVEQDSSTHLGKWPQGESGSSKGEMCGAQPEEKESVGSHHDKGGENKQHGLWTLTQRSVEPASRRESPSNTNKECHTEWTHSALKLQDH